MDQRLRAKGKFFFSGDQKVYLKGVSYGPFQAGSHGHPFPEREGVEKDFGMMSELGVNCIRTYNPPPGWMLEAAERHGLWVMVGIPWAEHVTFLDCAKVKKGIRAAVIAAVEQCKEYQSTFCYLIGNEISPDIIRWHGPASIQKFLEELAEIVRDRDPVALVSYASFPSTEFLDLDFIDFLSFNVYLHNQADFQKYLARLQNIAGSRPLVLSEFGADSIREGEAEQGRILDQKLATSFAMGAAGTVVFAWTDEWFTGGHLISDWAFGLVTNERKPKRAFEVVKQYYQQPLPPLPKHCPRVSVVVCAYNADRTIDTCLAALQNVSYPDYEVIVVNDGSTDRTLDICHKYPYIKLICQENRGLSVARNVGMDAATGQIIAYTDADCDVDPDWITYLIHGFLITGRVAVGGPNFPPPEDALVPSCVAVSPGGPTHVLLDDLEAEHIAGCNMAFKADVLRALGGFDPQYRAAGDDVDICWRLQDAGYEIGFSPAAQVWHFRRNTIKDYFKQQKGYGKAEAMVYFKHPERFNRLGQARWMGRIYGDMAVSVLPSKPFIYAGVFGMAPFQSLYQPPASLWSYLPQTLEWNLIGLGLILLLLISGNSPVWGFLPLAVTVLSSLVNAWKAPVDPRFRGLRSRLLIATMVLFGPLVRTLERYTWRNRIFRLRDRRALPKSEATIRMGPWMNTVFANYWTDQGVERAALLQDIIHLLTERKYFVNIQDGWTPWDLRVQQGIWSYAYLQSCAENHGGNDRLLRLKMKLSHSGLTKGLMMAWAMLVTVPLSHQAYGLAGVLLATGLLIGAGLQIQTLRMGRSLLRVFDLSARRLALVDATVKGK
jgi:glycosyltransferase involved in cell wall biosynthesis